MDRHTAKGSSLSRRDSLISHVSQSAPAAPGSTSPEASKAKPSWPDPRPRADSVRSTQDHSSAMYSPVADGHTSPYMNGHHSGQYGLADYGGQQGYRTHPTQPQSPLLQNTNQHPHSPFGSMSPALHGQAYGVPTGSGRSNGNFVAQQNVMPFHLPPAQYTGGHSMPSQDSAPSYEGITSVDTGNTPAQTSEMMLLNQMSMAGTVPIFGGDGVLSKSPYGGMPDDFLTYLFNSNSVPGSPRSQDLAQGTFSRFVSFLHHTKPRRLTRFVPVIAVYRPINIPCHFPGTRSQLLAISRLHLTRSWLLTVYWIRTYRRLPSPKTKVKRYLTSSKTGFMLTARRRGAHAMIFLTEIVATTTICSVK